MKYEFLFNTETTTLNHIQYSFRVQGTTRQEILGKKEKRQFYTMANKALFKTILLNIFNTELSVLKLHFSFSALNSLLNQETLQYDLYNRNLTCGLNPLNINMYFCSMFVIGKLKVPTDCQF